MSRKINVNGSYSSFLFMFLKYNNGLGGYSVRKLRSDYTGKCMTVLRVSDNATRDIFFDNNELDQADILDFLQGGSGLVSDWANQAVGGVNVVQSNTSMMPLIATSGVINMKNGKPALRFQNDLLKAVSGFDNTDTRSNFITLDTAGAFTGSYHNAYIYLNSAGATVDFQHLQLLSGGTIKSNYPTASLDQTAYTYIDNISQIISQIKTPITASLYKNFDTDVIKSGVQNLADSLNLGMFSTHSINGNIQEMLVFSDDKTPDKNNIVLDTNDYFNAF